MKFFLVDELLRLAILEDIGKGDITTELTIPEYCFAEAHIIAKEDLVVAGMPFVERFFSILSDEKILIEACFRDGEFVKKGETIARLRGKARILLSGERIALNILQRLSGIATLTNKFIKKVENYQVKILDTRKTTPGFRFFEKYAVKVGGGHNHRFALYDAILIKDNHIKIVGSVKEAVVRAKKSSVYQKIEVEVRELEQLKEAVEAGADIVMLDNMDLDSIRQAVKIAKGKVLIEVSGGVTLENVEEFAATGVDFISSGALTHSARAVDISMKIMEVL